jgi:hypothetical protein
MGYREIGIIEVFDPAILRLPQWRIVDVTNVRTTRRRR